MLMDGLKAVTLELLRMLSGRAFHNSGPDLCEETMTSVNMTWKEIGLIEICIPVVYSIKFIDLRMFIE